MTKNITNSGRWKSGESGNPKGRPTPSRALAEVLRLTGEESFIVGGEDMPAQVALARAVWRLVVTGEVWLAGKRLETESVTEWVNVVKWLYQYVAPPQQATDELEPEMVVRVVRVDRTPEDDKTFMTLPETVVDEDSDEWTSN